MGLTPPTCFTAAEKLMVKQNFRVTLRADFRLLRMCVFADEMSALTGETSLKGLLVELSVATGGVSKIAAWRARLRGEFLPRQDLLNLLQKKFPDMCFELLHPAWDLLAHPDMNRRTLRRLLAGRPEQWHRTRALLGTLPTTELSVRASLPDTLQLRKLDFLDALLLFWCERKDAIAAKLEQRRAILDQILWLLPVLYPLDPLWRRADLYRERHRYMLHAFDLGLDMVDDHNPGTKWGWHRREVVIFKQQWDMQKHMRTYPEALRSEELRMRFFAKNWYWRYGEQSNE